MRSTVQQKQIFLDVRLSHSVPTALLRSDTLGADTGSQPDPASFRPDQAIFAGLSVSECVAMMGQLLSAAAYMSENGSVSASCSFCVPTLRFGFRFRHCLRMQAAYCAPYKYFFTVFLQRLVFDTSSSQEP